MVVDLLNSLAKDSTAPRAARSNATFRRDPDPSHRGAAPLVETVMQGVDQHATTLDAVDQVVLQVGIALDHPDVAEHFVEHAGRSPGAALAPQLIEDRPDPLAEQTDDDLAIGERVGLYGISRSRGPVCGRHELGLGTFRLDGIERQGKIEQGSVRDGAVRTADCTGISPTDEAVELLARRGGWDACGKPLQC